MRYVVWGMWFEVLGMWSKVSGGGLGVELILKLLKN